MTKFLQNKSKCFKGDCFEIVRNFWLVCDNVRVILNIYLVLVKMLF